jgi:putative ABC transport system permease protein
MPVHRLLTQLSADLRYAIRVLRKTPAFTVITALTLALGIGANTAIFSVFDAVLVRPLPYRDPGRLVSAGEAAGRQPGSGGFSAGTLLDWRERNAVFEHLAGWHNAGFNLAAAGLPERVEGMRVTWDYFETLGVAPRLGRGFLPADDRPDAPRVAVLSDAVWRRVFAGDPGAIGRSVIVDGQPCTIVGVLPRAFRFFYGPEMWMPMGLNPAGANRSRYYISGVARLKPGVAIEQARARTAAIAASVNHSLAPPGNWTLRVEPLANMFVAQKERDRLLVLFGAVGFVLLIACANAANLLLARAAGRRREMAVRAALGAGRATLVRQALTESVSLSLAGGIAGCLLAFGALRFLPGLLSPTLVGGRAAIGLDARVLAFTLALSILTGVVFGIVPAWRASRLNLHDSLQQGGGRGWSGLSTHGRFGRVLVAGEVALSLVLLAAGGLMIRSLSAMQAVDLGFRGEHVLTMSLAMSPERYGAPAATGAFYREVLARTTRIPGVRSASIAMGQAPWDTPEATSFNIAGQPPPKPGEMRAAALERVSPDYFRTMGMRLRKGRFFTAADDERAPRAAIVSQTFVTMYLPHDDPIGQRVLLGDDAWQIVGVVSDIRFGGPEAINAPFLYLPMLASPVRNGALALLTAGDPMSVSQTVRAVVAGIDRGTPLTKTRSLDRIALDSMSQPRLQASLMAVFAGAALLLAALGIYGVLSYAVAQSTHELGIRMALGARAADVLKLVLGQGLLLTGAGLAAGFAGALALTRLLESMLFHVKPADPLTFAAVALLLAVVAVAAALVPARRATRVDPLAAIRSE